MSDENPRKHLSPDRLRELEGDWRAGLLPPKVIAAKYGLSVDVVRALAQKAGWDRGDLGAAIDRETTRAVVSRAVGTSDSDTVRQYGEIVAGVIEGHRARIGRQQAFIDRLEAELASLEEATFDKEAVSGVVMLLEQASDGVDPALIKALKGDDKRSLVPVTIRLAVLEQKTKIASELAKARKVLVELERQAWQLDKEKGQGGVTYDDFLAELYGEDNGKPPNAQTRLN